MMMYGFPVDLSGLLDAFLQNQSATLVCCDSLLADAQVNPTGGTLRGGFASSIRICKQHRRMGKFFFLSQGRSPLSGPTLLPSLSRFGTRLLRSPPRFHSGSLKNGSPVWPPVTAIWSLIPEALTLYRCHPLQASHTFQAGCEVRTSFANLLSPPANTESRLQKLHYCRSMLKARCSATGALTDVSVKLDQLDDACCFLSTRLRVRDSSTRLSVRLREFISLLLSGGYRRYASGLWRCLQGSSGNPGVACALAERWLH